MAAAQASQLFEAALVDEVELGGGRIGPVVRRLIVCARDGTEFRRTVCECKSKWGGNWGPGRREWAAHVSSDMHTTWLGSDALRQWCSSQGCPALRIIR